MDGHRADLVMMKAAKTTAALNRKEVMEKDVRECVNLALFHRMRQDLLTKWVLTLASLTILGK